MFKKRATLIVIGLLLSLLLIVPNRAFPSNPPPSPYELIEDTNALPATLDPANCYDTGSGEVLFNTYEPLIFFDGERYDVFTPGLATQVWVGPPASGAPNYTYFSIYFKIRTGVPFHTWCRTDAPSSWSQYYLTTADVEYSFERWMVHDYTGGPQWMIFEALLGCQMADESWPSDDTNPINQAVQRNSTHVWFNIANQGLEPISSPVNGRTTMFDADDGRFRGAFWDDVGALPLNYPLRILFQVIAQMWASIMSKDWVLDFVIPNAPDMNGTQPGDQKDWPGTWSNWRDYTRWQESPLDKIPGNATYPGVACGTGPYILDRYDPTTEWSLVKNDDYWRGWPAREPSPPYPPETSSGIKPAGFLKRLTIRYKGVNARIADLKDGTCDLASIPRASAGELHKDLNRNGPTLEGIRLNYPIPSVAISSTHYTFCIESTPENTYGKIYNNDTYAEDGIPANFFADIHTRKAFTYLFNFTFLLVDQLFNEAYQPRTCAPYGLPYVNSYQATYGPDPDLVKARAEFDQINNGAQWLSEIGFTITLAYNTGNIIRQAMCENLASLINRIGDDYYGGRFHASAVNFAWPDYVDAMWAHLLPVFHTGWLADYCDLQSFMYAYMHSQGSFAVAQRYYNAEADALLTQAVRTPDGPARQALYYRLQEIYYEDVPSITTYVALGRGYQRSWVQGFYCNPQYPGVYAYSIWKWEYKRGNVNYDHWVDLTDIVTIFIAYGTYGDKQGAPVSHARWNFRCDIDGNPQDGWRDRRIDIYDIAVTLDNFGQIDTVWTPPP
jgi:peptide/nickel transport system substrate-binding protein